MKTPLWLDTATVFSPDRVYRYSLERWLLPFHTNRVTFIMLNPSTADENVDDPTVRRCVGYAMAWGFSRLRVVNIFALRSTDPKALYSHDDPVGPDNMSHIIEAARCSDLVVCAWGTHGALTAQGYGTARILSMAGYRLDVLGLTKDGHPKHPLYLPTKARPMQWEPS